MLHTETNPQIDSTRPVQRVEEAHGDGSVRLEWRLRPATALRALMITIITLTFISTIGRVAIRGTDVDSHRWLHAIVRRTNVDYELAIPAWFSSVLILACALVLTRIATGYRSARHPASRHWFGLAGIFGLLAIDEATACHEMLIVPLRTMLGTGGLLHFAWIIPGAGFAVFVGIAYRRFLFDLHPEIRRLFLVAATLFLGSAVGLEAVGGFIIERHGEHSLSYIATSTIEEFGEMTGMAIFFFALLRNLEIAMPSPAPDELTPQGGA